MGQTATSPYPRLVFVDALRLIAAFQMVQGHSVDAVLAAAHRSGPLFHAWTFARGLTSTIFFVTAGMAFVLANDAAKDPAASVRRRVRRACELIGIGYLLHAPLSVLFGSELSSALREAMVVDVLQCMGVSLLLLELLWLAIASRALRASVAACLGLACFALAPVTDRVLPVGFARLFQNYVSYQGGSLFPLIPCAGFVLCGFAVGLLSLPQRDAPLRAPFAVLAGVGVSCVLAGALGLALGPDLSQRISPAFSLLKLGLVLSLSAAVAFSLRGVVRLPKLLGVLAGETLFLYVSHVLILYAGHVGVSAHWGGSAGPWAGLALALVLLLTCSAGALGYRRVSRALRRRWGRGTPRAQTPFPSG